MDNFLVIEGGSSGLVFACELAKNGKSVSLYGANDRYGGISRAGERDGWKFDIGGHRFIQRFNESKSYY